MDKGVRACDIIRAYLQNRPDSGDFLVIFNEVCDLVSRDNLSRNSPHQSRITNFFWVFAACVEPVIVPITFILQESDCVCSASFIIPET